MATKYGIADAAAALEKELARFEELAESLQQARLSSEKALVRAAKALQDTAASQERQGELLRALTEALGAAQRRQAAVAEALTAHTESIRSRANAYADLRGRMAALGDDAREVNELVQAVAARTRTGGEQRPEDVARDLEAIEARMGGIVENAKSLATAAHEQGMDDLARETDALRQQMLASKNKVTLLVATIQGSGRDPTRLH